jgi:SpoIID/LytB domain protein
MRRFFHLLSALFVGLFLGVHILVLVPSAAAEEVDGPIRLVPRNPHSSTRVEARFSPIPNACPARQPGSLNNAYPGTLEIGRRSDGKLYLVTELDFRRYLKGIAEVPRDWPLEALKAQVVAARTYAISHLNPETAVARELRYNLCATAACQVYRGLVVENGAWGEMWSKAVDDTAGEVLEYQGKPASTFYFSTSNGQTYSNTEAFGGSALPYLKPIQEKDDKQSPYAAWEVKMPLKDLSEALRLAGAWGEGEIERVSQNGDSIALEGAGQSATLGVTDFRNKVNQQALCLTPKRYPTLAGNGRPLPQVLPSKWLELRQGGGEVVIKGSGWGHGVGMVQWGLKGKAERGMTHAQMLAFYYGGLRPVKRSEPGSIRIGLAIDLEEITIETRGDVAVEGANFPSGPVRIAGGPRITVERGRPIAPVLRLTKVASSETAGPGAPASFSFELSSPAKIAVRYAGPASGISAVEPRDRGPQSFSWDASGLAPGQYSVNVVASDGIDEVSSSPVKVAVSAPPPSPSPSPSLIPIVAKDERSGGLGLIFRVLLAVALALLVIGAALLIARRRTQR